MLIFAVQSLLDDYGLADVNSVAEEVKQAVEQQQFQKATELWSMAESAVEQVGTQRSRSKRNCSTLQGFILQVHFVIYIGIYYSVYQ